MPLTAIISKLETIQRIAENSMEKSVEDSEQTLIELQKERMDMGLDVNGNFIEYNKRRTSELNETGAYTKKYAKYKSSRGGNTSVVDLELTGDYKNSLKAETKKTGKGIDVDIKSNVSHAKYIEKHYDDIYGLDKRQQELIEKVITRQIETDIENHLRL